MGLTVDCNVTCGKEGFVCLGEMLCCVVVFTVVTTSSFAKCDSV